MENFGIDFGRRLVPPVRGLDRRRHRSVLRLLLQGSRRVQVFWTSDARLRVGECDLWLDQSDESRHCQFCSGLRPPKRLRERPLDPNWLAVGLPLLGSHLRSDGNLDLAGHRLLVAHLQAVGLSDGRYSRQNLKDSEASFWNLVRHVREHGVSP